MREACQGRGRADERRGVERGRHPVLSDERARYGQCSLVNALSHEVGLDTHARPSVLHRTKEIIYSVN